MADYREHYPKIESLGARVAAVSVDPPQISEKLRAEISLPFPILCDTERRVIEDWGIHNTRERGGIATPAVFIIDRGRVVRYAATDEVVRRVPAAEIVFLLQDPSAAQPVRRKVYIPLPSHWIKAVRNSFSRGT